MASCKFCGKKEPVMHCVCAGCMDKLENQPRWINVKERLPKCDNTILLYYGAVDIEIYFEDKFRMFDKNGYPFEVRYVTHWMPLPELPEEDDCGS